MEVTGDFGDSAEWLLECSLLPMIDDGFFATPNVLFAGNNPCIPVANLSPRARMLRRGKAIGIVSKPIETFDKPTNLQDLEGKMRHAAKASVVVNALHASSSPTGSKGLKTKGTDSDEPWGPKGAELPVDEEYKSNDLEKLIDVGTLPDHLK